VGWASGKQWVGDGAGVGCWRWLGARVGAGGAVGFGVVCDGAGVDAGARTVVGAGVDLVLVVMLYLVLIWVWCWS